MAIAYSYTHAHMHAHEHTHAQTHTHTLMDRVRDVISFILKMATLQHVFGLFSLTLVSYLDQRVKKSLLVLRFQWRQVIL